MDLEGKVNSMVGRKKNEEGDCEGFSYICKLSKFECAGRKGIIKYLKDSHQTEWNGLMAQIKDEDPETQLVKLISNAAFVEPEKKIVKISGGITNGVAKSKVAQITPEEKEAKALLSTVEKAEGRKDYPVSLVVLRMIDARTTNIPNYGSLMGRIARLLAIVVGKEKVKSDDENGDKKEGEEEKKEGEEMEVEDEEVTFHCYKCDVDLGGSYSDIMPHLEDKHGDFVNLLCTIFPPAKKRLSQFVEKAAEKFDLVVPTEKEVQRLIIQDKVDKQKELAAIALKRKQEWEETKKARDEKKRKLAAEAEAEALKRKQEWEETKKAIDEKKRKLAAEWNAKSESQRRKQERDRVKAELKKTSTASNGSVRRKRLEKRLEELRDKIKAEYVQKNADQLEKRTKALLENLSPKQLRKICMNYFEGLTSDKEITWKETLEAIKMDEEYSFIADFLILLHDYSRVNYRKSFKLGHMLITNNQAELIYDKGWMSLRNARITDAWIIPSSWTSGTPDEDLGENWNRKDDSRLIIGAVKFGRNLTKIVNFWPALSQKSLDEERNVKKSVKDRFAYLLNVYYNRGKYNEEFGLCLFTEDVNDEEALIDDDIDDDVVEIFPQVIVTKKSKTASKETKEEKEEEKMEEEKTDEENGDKKEDTDEVAEDEVEEEADEEESAE